MYNIGVKRKEDKDMTKKVLRSNQIVTVIKDDEEVVELYPTGEKEFNDCVEAYVQDLWYGDCIKVTAEYSTYDRGVETRHTAVYTEYGKEPEVSSRVIE